MAVFLLVHGSWHGAWCWSRLIGDLEARGHRAVALDLPAHGADRTFPYRVFLGSYSRAIRQAAEGIGEPVVGVGHSMGGAALSQAMEDGPALFRRGILLAAFAPVDGDSVIRLSRGDAESLVPQCTSFGPIGALVDPARATDLFYADCDEETAREAISRLRPDPYWPVFQRFRTRASQPVPRDYIECAEDRAISLGAQRAMAARAGVEITGSLATSHSPFLSAPAELAQLLTGLADR